MCTVGTRKPELLCYYAGWTTLFCAAGLSLILGAADGNSDSSQALLGIAWQAGQTRPVKEEACGLQNPEAFVAQSLCNIGYSVAVVPLVFKLPAFPWPSRGTRFTLSFKRAACIYVVAPLFWTNWCKFQGRPWTRDLDRVMHVLRTFGHNLGYSLPIGRTTWSGEAVSPGHDLVISRRDESVGFYSSSCSAANITIASTVLLCSS